VGAFKNILQNISSPKGNNWKAIVLSIMAASVFWLFQSLNKEYSTNLNYPIVFDYPAEQYVVIKKLPDEVQINVNGIGWNIFRKTFSIGLIPIRVPLENPSTTPKIIGTSLLANINDQLPQFQVNYVITDTLFLDIDQKSSRTFKIFADSLSIDIKNNYRITSNLIIDPDSVTIMGPISIITQLPPNLPIRISQQNIDEPFDDDIKFEIRGFQQSLLEVTPENINVEFEVEEYVTVSYTTSLLVADSIPSNIYAIDSTVNVTYSIPRSAQASVDKDQIHVVALPETLNKEDSTVELSIRNYPEQIAEIKLDSTSQLMKVIYE
jgi:hypothetical protein